MMARQNVDSPKKNARTLPSPFIPSTGRIGTHPGFVKRKKKISYE
jgi:hypothetical protein